MHPPGHEASPTVVSLALVDALGTRLKGRLDSVIAHGSWVHGDYCPGRSDLDLVVVLHDEPDPDLVSAVRPILDDITAAYPAWHDRLEVGLVTRHTVQAVLDGDENSHRVGRVSPGEPLHLVPADRHRLLDWEAAHRGRTLYGAPASEAITAVPPDAVRRVVHEHLLSWPRWLTESDSSGYQAYAVLTVSRAAGYLATGGRLSKREGAAWVADHLPAWRPLVAWAVEWWYCGGDDGQAPPAGVRDFVTEVARP